MTNSILGGWDDARFVANFITNGIMIYHDLD